MYHQQGFNSDQNIFTRSKNKQQKQPSHMAINTTGTISFNDPSSTHWFNTSMESNASPVFEGLVTPSSSTGHLIDGFGENDDKKDHYEIFEKRRRRRESHNAVERRRRDNINERIQELSTLLPDHLLESVPASANVMTVTTGQSGTNGKPINKGTILKLSVDHIKELRHEVSRCKTKIRDLEHLIELAKRNRHGSVQFQQQYVNLHITSDNT